jgi:peptidoglycan hydrolase-like protein with peptidoglycan-binding domain
MSEEQHGLRQSKRFDLLANPFSILDLSPTASVPEIAQAFAAAATSHMAEADLIAAREALTDPRQRTLVELSFLLDTDTQEVKGLLAALKKDASSEEIVRLADRLAPLSKANLLVHAGSRRPASTNLLLGIIEAHACIDPKAVFAGLEATRQAAGLAIPTFDSVGDGLHELLSLHANAVLSAYPTARAAARPIEECTRRTLKSAHPGRIDALEGIIRAFGATITPALLPIEEQIKDATAALRDRPNELAPMYSLASNLRKWIGLARPLVELEAHKGVDEERARQLFLEVRGLSVDLADQHDRGDVALSICKIAADAFKQLPRASEQLSEDRATLEERSAERPILPLRRWIEERHGNSTALIQDLETSGFGASSVREARDLWGLFAMAAARTQGTDVADLPWTIVRRLATDISKNERSVPAAKAVLEGLLGYAQHISPSEQLLELTRDDFRALDRDILEQQPAEEPEADPTSSAPEPEADPASSALEPEADPASSAPDAPYFLMDSKPSEDRAVVAAPQGRRRARNTARYVKWGALVLVGALVLFGGIAIRSSHPPTVGSDASLLQQTPDVPPDQTQTRSPDSASEKAELLIDMPPIGSGLMLSQANLRYCLYQKARISALQSDLRSPEETTAFNAIVGDYNSRCGHFQYREGDFRIVTNEVKEKSDVLAAEGRSIASGWRADPSLQPTLAAQDEPSFAATTPPIPTPATSDQAVNPDPASAMASSDLDLLQLETASKTQRRLNQLGYFHGPNNGAWGPQSRSALRSFKVANGLSNDDALDQMTAARLYSPSAAKGTSSFNAAAAATAATESSYPPPQGATLNPLNRSDATKIHAKLRELGFYRGTSNTLWSAASRDALKEFKTSSALAANDQWDASTETRLLSASPGKPPDDLPAGFAAATGGTWSTDIRACPGAAGGSDALPLKITQNRAETEGARCEFANVSGLGTNWKTVGTCTVNGQTRKANISLVRTGDALVWSSENGTTKYLRCAN